MKNHLVNLQNNESILLMYLAGELPGEDRAEVEGLLQSDQSLRLLLEELQGTQDFVAAQLRAADQATPLVGQFAASRQVGAIIRQKHADALRDQQNAPAELSHRPMSWWITGPLVGAACLALGMFLWWHYGANDVDGPIGYATNGLSEEERAMMYSWDRRNDMNSLGARSEWLANVDDGTGDTTVSDNEDPVSEIKGNALDSLLDESVDSVIN